MYSHDGKQGPVLMYNDLTQDDLFDKSSYAKTLIGEQSVYSDKTLISKLTLKSNNGLISKTPGGLENESVKELNPKNNNNGDYVALDVK